ncbi:MAG: caspase family protein, partial [Bacteroidota bacterium]
TWDIAMSVKLPASSSLEKLADQKEYLSADSLYAVSIDRFYLRKKDRRSGKTLFTKVPVDIAKNFTSVAGSEKSKMIVAGNEDGKIYVFDLGKGKSLGTLGEHFSSVNSVCFAPDGKIFASGSTDRSIIVWDAKTLRPLKRLSGRSYRFESIEFNHTGTQVAVGDELGRGRIIELQSSRVRVSVSSWHNQKISDIAFSKNDSTIFSGGFDNRLAAINVRNGNLVSELKYKKYFSLNDFLLKKLQVYRDPYAWVSTVGISPEGSKLAIAGAWRESQVRKQPQAIRIKDLQSDKSYKLLADQGSVNDIHFLSEQSFLSAGADGLIQWYHDGAEQEFYFRKKITGLKNIQRILPGSNNTVLLQGGKQLILYSLIEERILDSIHVLADITAAAFEAKSGKVMYAMFNTLVTTNISSWHQERKEIHQAHSDRITDIKFNPTYPIVGTVSWDATVKLWNANTSELEVTIIPFGTDDHLIVTPDNYYYGTRNSLRGIGFKYGKQFITPEQFDLRFNRPDIVLERLGFAPKEVIRSFQRAYQKRLQKMNFTEQMLSEEIHLPEVKLVNENLPLQTTQAQFTFSLLASDDKYNLDRVNVFVNHIPVYGVQGIDLRNRQVKKIDLPVSVTLAAGKNRVQVSCLNEKGVESLLETFDIELIDQRIRRPNLYLAVVSVSKYAQQTMNLRYARKDGQDLVNLFKRSGWFSNVVVDTLYDARATKENIAGLRDKFLQSDVNDQVMLFVSGHGLLDDKLDFYYATHDVDFKDPAKRGMAYGELEGLLDGIPARKKLLMMDACHSGEVDKSKLQVAGTGVLNKNQRGAITAYTYPVDVAQEHYNIGITTSFELMQELFANLSKGSGAVVISAAAGNSFALESDEWQNGVFTYALLNGLKSKSADANKNGEITVSELKDFVSREVERLTKGAQKPTSRRENLEFDFRIW